MDQSGNSLDFQQKNPRLLTTGRGLITLVVSNTKSIDSIKFRAFVVAVCRTFEIRLQIISGIKMANRHAISKVKQICLALPDTAESEKWGKPHFCVNGKIFAGCGEEDERFVVGFKLEMDHAASIIKRPGFSKAPYVGHKGWVSMDPTVVTDWSLIRDLILESYQLIAPKRSIAKLPEVESPTIKQAVKRKLVTQKKAAASAANGKKPATTSGAKKKTKKAAKSTKSSARKKSKSR